MAEPLRFPMAGDHPLLRLVQGPSRALRRVVRLLQAAVRQRRCSHSFKIAAADLFLLNFNMPGMNGFGLVLVATLPESPEALQGGHYG